MLMSQHLHSAAARQHTDNLSLHSCVLVLAARGAPLAPPQFAIWHARQTLSCAILPSGLCHTSFSCQPQTGLSLCTHQPCCGVQVFWVDLLTREEFEAGFGSHTPMFTGQTKCVRYYMNFKRGLNLFRAVALKVSSAVILWASD